MKLPFGRKKKILANSVDVIPNSSSIADDSSERLLTPETTGTPSPFPPSKIAKQFGYAPLLDNDDNDDVSDDVLMGVEDGNNGELLLFDDDNGVNGNEECSEDDVLSEQDIAEMISEMRQEQRQAEEEKEQQQQQEKEKILKSLSDVDTSSSVQRNIRLYNSNDDNVSNNLAAISRRKQSPTAAARSSAMELVTGLVLFTGLLLLCLVPFLPFFLFLVTLVQSALTVAAVGFTWTKTDQTVESFEMRVSYTLLSFMLSVALVWASPALAIQLFLLFCIIHMVYATKYALFVPILLSSVATYTIFYMIHLVLGGMSIVLLTALLSITMIKTKPSTEAVRNEINLRMGQLQRANKQATPSRNRLPNTSKFAFTRVSSFLKQRVSTVVASYQCSISDYYLIMVGHTPANPRYVAVGVLHCVFLVPLFAEKKRSSNRDSGFVLFCRQEIQELIRSGISEAKIASVASDLREKWQEMNIQDKQKYLGSA